jgi:hypothetical protein
MRKTMAIARKQTSHGHYLIGSIAAEKLASIAGISAVTIDSQALDRATLSYLSAGDERLAEIDFALGAAGLHRA